MKTKALSLVLKMYPIKWTRGIKKDLESGHEKGGGRPPKVDRDTDSKAKRWTAMVYWSKEAGVFIESDKPYAG